MAPHPDRWSRVTADRLIGDRGPEDAPDQMTAAER